MTREQIINLGDRLSWICPNCEDIADAASQHQQQAGPSDPTKFFYGKVIPAKLKILQLNIDSVMSKLHELKKFLKEYKISVALIQETKLIKSDKKPVIPGYTVRRKDRIQPKGKEKDRGGGLLIVIKNNIPYKESPLVLASDGDKTAESRTIEIPTENDKMLRITNLYIPPVKTKPGGVSASFIESRIGMQNWPSETCDLILGDCNAHSVL